MDFEDRIRVWTGRHIQFLIFTWTFTYVQLKPYIWTYSLYWLLTTVWLLLSPGASPQSRFASFKISRWVKVKVCVGEGISARWGPDFCLFYHLSSQNFIQETQTKLHLRDFMKHIILIPRWRLFQGKFMKYEYYGSFKSAPKWLLRNSLLVLLLKRGAELQL